MAIDIEAIIKDAQQRGVFNDLPGQGQPLREDEFKDLPEEIRMTYRILREAGFAPGEVNLKKTLEELRLKIQRETDPQVKEKLLLQLNRIETELNIKLEQIASLVSTCKP